MLNVSLVTASADGFSRNKNGFPEKKTKQKRFCENFIFHETKVIRRIFLIIYLQMLKLKNTKVYSKWDIAFMKTINFAKTFNVSQKLCLRMWALLWFFHQIVSALPKWSTKCFHESKTYFHENLNNFRDKLTWLNVCRNMPP